VRGAEPVTDVEQAVDVAPLPPRELIHDPDGDSGLPQGGDLVRLLLLPFGAQPAGKFVPGRDEVAQRRAVELVEPLARILRHAGSTPSCQKTNVQRSVAASSCFERGFPRP
jgi:hypothetical protein